MDRTDVAFWLSIASATVTVCGLAWQLALYRLNGARLVVRLIPTVLDQMRRCSQAPPADGCDAFRSLVQTPACGTWTSPGSR